MPPKVEKIVTNQKIASLDAKDKAYKFFVGKGLYLLVKPNGAKYWRMKYRIDGKEKSLSGYQWMGWGDVRTRLR